MSPDHVVAAATAQPADFISNLSIEYGPRDLLARYFLAERRLRERGSQGLMRTRSGASIMRLGWC